MGITTLQAYVNLLEKRLYRSLRFKNVRNS